MISKLNIIKSIDWFPISNKTIYEGVIGKIDKNTFATLCYFMANEKLSTTTIKTLSENLNIKDVRTIKKILIKLIDNNFILIDKDINNINANTPIYINIIYKSNTLNEKSFERIPVDLFNECIKRTDHYCWAILCSLCVYHNKEYGYAFPSFKILSKNLKIGDKLISECIKKLKEEKFIKIGKDKIDFVTNGIDMGKYLNNKYYLRYLEEDTWKKYISKKSI